jgi:hypothetical protein
VTFVLLKLEGGMIDIIGPFETHKEAVLHMGRRQLLGYQIQKMKSVEESKGTRKAARAISASPGVPTTPIVGPGLPTPSMIAEQQSASLYAQQTNALVEWSDDFAPDWDPTLLGYSIYGVTGENCRRWLDAAIAGMYTYFDPVRKIAIIKALRHWAMRQKISLGLKEAKDAVDAFCAERGLR